MLVSVLAEMPGNVLTNMYCNAWEWIDDVSPVGSLFCFYCLSYSCSHPFPVSSVILFPIFYAHSQTQCNIPNARTTRIQRIDIALLMYYRSNTHALRCILYAFPTNVQTTARRSLEGMEANSNVIRYPPMRYGVQRHSNAFVMHYQVLSKRRCIGFKWEQGSPLSCWRSEAFQRICRPLPGVF